MAVGSIVDISTTLLRGPDGGKPASLSMAGVSLTDLREVIPERAFQFWPESMTDSIEIGWNELQVPGLSHGIMQWSFNGGRTISFEVVIGRYLKHEEDAGFLELIPDANDTENKPYNADVREAIKYLRSFCYPQYSLSDVLEEPPPACLLHAPGMNLNEDGRDTIWTVMTGCEVTYNRCFPSGRPRLATVSITLKQIIQSPRAVSAKGRGNAIDPAIIAGNVDFGRERNNPDQNRP